MSSLIRVSSFSPLLSSLHSHLNNDSSLRNMTNINASHKIPPVCTLLKQKNFISFVDQILLIWGVHFWGRGCKMGAAVSPSVRFASVKFVS